MAEIEIKPRISQGDAKAHRVRSRVEARERLVKRRNEYAIVCRSLYVYALTKQERRASSSPLP